jgi:hypothetical protein
MFKFKRLHQIITLSSFARTGSPNHEEHLGHIFLVCAVIALSNEMICTKEKQPI